jgi:hypothetical protein
VPRRTFTGRAVLKQALSKKAKGVCTHTCLESVSFPLNGNLCPINQSEYEALEGDEASKSFPKWFSNGHSNRYLHSLKTNNSQNK